MPIINRKAQELIALLDEDVQEAERVRNALSVDLRQAQYRFECLTDARTRVAEILAELDKPEEPPF